MKQFTLKLLLFVSIAVFCVSVKAQTSSNARRIASGTAVPSGACSIGPPYTQVYIRTTDHSIYECTGASTWTLIATGSTPLGGSGTSGQVAFWDSTFTVTGSPNLTFVIDTLTPTKIGTTTLTGTTTATGAMLLNSGILPLDIRGRDNVGTDESVIRFYRFNGTTLEGSIISTGTYQALRDSASAEQLQWTTTGVTLPGKAFVSTNLTNAAGTPGSVCYNTSTFELTKNNALTCTVSSRDYKQNISAFPKRSAFDRLRPVTFAYRDQPNRQRWGFIAEEAAQADRRFADGYDANGIPRSLDQNAILAALVSEVQHLKARVAELEAKIKP